MPKLISVVNRFGSVGIQSDGTSQLDAAQLNFQSNRVEVQAGIATVYTDPLTIVGL
jgi:hypothetical protein